MKINLFRRNYVEWEEYFMKVLARNHINLIDKTCKTYLKKYHKQDIPIDLSGKHISNLLSQQLRQLSFD